jgi:alpha-mannosidase
MTPGYIKRTPVAWFATHHNTPQGDAYYAYSYLFQLSYDLPSGAKSITLPDHSKIRVFAVTVSREPPATPPAAPLYDTLADHRPGDAPIVTQAGQSFTDVTQIALLPPLYHQPHSLHYTLDGSDPTAASPVYEGPFFAEDTVNIAAREIDPNGGTSPVARGVVNIHDTTAPRLVSALTSGPDTLELRFSAPLKAASACNPANYSIQPLALVKKITLAPDGVDVTLTSDKPLNPGTGYAVALHGIEDASPAGNQIAPVTVPFNAQNIVYTLDSADLPGGAVTKPVSNLPVLRNDHWTMNLFVKTGATPRGRVLIAGFGPPSEDEGKGGSERYIAVADDGIRFWSGGTDIKTNSPIDLGRWQMLTATYDGDTLALYKDGQAIGKSRKNFSANADGNVSVGPLDPWDHQRIFQGSVRDFTIRRENLTKTEVKKLFETTKAPQ